MVGFLKYSKVKLSLEVAKLEIKLMLTAKLDFLVEHSSHHRFQEIHKQHQINKVCNASF